MIDILTSILNELKSIHHVLKSANRHQRLWNTDDIADYLNVSKSTVQSTVLKSPGFPKPKILPTGGKRWLSSEVQLWIKRNQKG